MKLFKNIKKWLENQEHLFYMFLVILIVPNVVLCFTEPLPLMGKSVQCVIAFCLLLSVDDFIPELWENVMDFVLICFFRSFSDRIALLIRSVDYRCRYVSEFGNNQF